VCVTQRCFHSFPTLQQLQKNSTGMRIPPLLGQSTGSAFYSQNSVDFPRQKANKQTNKQIQRRVSVGTNPRDETCGGGKVQPTAGRGDVTVGGEATDCGPASSALQRLRRAREAVQVRHRRAWHPPPPAARGAGRGSALLARPLASAAVGQRWAVAGGYKGGGGEPGGVL